MIGFDIERHIYGEHRYPAQLVVQDMLTLHGSQFKDAALIVASPPCQEYSYMAMPWTRAKAKAAAIRADKTGASLEKLNRLFNACFRIQREACEAAGRHVPMVVENVKGAQPWVGRARWSFGSFYLWGDVPALMPITLRGIKVPSFRFDGNGGSFQSASVKQFAWNGNEQFQATRRTAPGNGTRFTSRDCGIESGIKCGGDWFNDAEPSVSRLTSSKSPARKFASAMIAKIPLPLSRHIAAVYAKP